MQRRRAKKVTKLLHAEIPHLWKPKVAFSKKDRQAYNQLIRKDVVAVNCQTHTTIVCTTGLSGMGHPELCVRGFPLDSLEMAKHAVLTLARRFHIGKQVCKTYECIVTAPGLLWTTIGLVNYDDARVLAEMADAYYNAPVLVLEYNLIGLWASFNILPLKFDFPLRDRVGEEIDESLVPGRLWGHVARRLEPLVPLHLQYIDGSIVTQHGIIYDVVKDMLQFRACVVCFERGNIAVCSGCYCVAYCSERHQTQDWTRHKTDCEFYRATFKLHTE